MANGYIVAAEADIAAAREIADGFDLDLIGAGAITDNAATAAALARAANVGLMLSTAAAENADFTALMRALAGALGTAQLILVTPEARAAFPYLPQTWPSMSLEQALARAQTLREQRRPGGLPPEEPARAHPLPRADGEQAQPPTAAQEEEASAPEQEAAPQTPAHEDTPESAEHDGTLAGAGETPANEGGGEAAAGGGAAASESFGADGETGQAPVDGASAPESAPSAPVGAAPPPQAAEPAPAPAPAPPASAPARGPSPAPHADELEAAKPSDAQSLPRTRAAPSQVTAPADATAFAPKKLRRGTPELVRIAIHQPKDLQAVIKAARQIDPRAEPAPSSMSVGEVALGSSVGVSLEVRGAACNGALQRRTWEGQPIDFSFSVEPDAEAKQAVLLARVFVDDAQIGVLAFTRPIGGAAKKAANLGDRARLKRHKRVFLSYSSHDREVVAAIATAYQSAGVAHFWDRTSLKSGEEWGPRLRREIERADLFHLCWSKAAAESEWVEKEAEFALERRHRSNGRTPDITVQMLDGPPWAPHPKHLDAINFDDFVRAAIVGYARGDGSA